MHSWKYILHPALPILCEGAVCVCVCDVCLNMTRLALLILNPKQTLPQMRLVLHPVTH